MIQKQGSSDYTFYPKGLIAHDKRQRMNYDELSRIIKLLEKPASPPRATPYPSTPPDVYSIEAIEQSSTKSDTQHASISSHRDHSSDEIQPRSASRTSVHRPSNSGVTPGGMQAAIDEANQNPDKPLKDIARDHGVNRKTLSSILSRHRELGVEGTRPKQPVGRRLSISMQAAINKANKHPDKPLEDIARDHGVKISVLAANLYNRRKRGVEGTRPKQSYVKPKSSDMQAAIDEANQHPNKSRAEIARKYGVNINTLRTNLSRLRQHGVESKRPAQPRGNR